MKTLFTLLTLTLALSSLAQEPMPFPSNQIWMIMHEDTTTHQLRNYSIAYTGDTYIDGLRYRVLAPMADCSGPYQLQPTKYLRDVEGVWYIKDNMDSLPRVYFDFNLIVGQEFDFGMGEEYAMTVTSIDSISMTNGTTRRLWTLGNGSHQFLEGAGEIYSCFQFYPGLISQSNDAIVCLKDNDGNLIHQMNDEQACCLPYGIPLPLNAKWTSDYQSVYPVQGTPFNYGMTLSEEQFTINGNNYYQIISGHYCPSDINSSYGYIRAQDSSWYYTYGQNSPEQLYFKFDAQVGQVFTGYSWMSGGQDYEVAAIDSIEMVDGSKRKRLALRIAFTTSTEYDYWIEGIGSQQMGIKHPVYLGGFWHHWEDLRCFVVDDEVVFNNANGPCCITVGIDEIQSNELLLYPTPAYDRLYIEPPYADKWQMSIYNMQGALIKQEQPHQLLQYAIDVQELPSGVYTVLCSDANGKVYAQKLIKE